MKIQFNSNYGHFATQITATVDDASNKTLAVEGLANILYRVCGSHVDKSIGIKKGDKRKEVEYDAALVGKIETAVREKIDELCGVNGKEPSDSSEEEQDYNDLGLVFTITGKHEFGETGQSAMVRATNLVDTFLADEDMEKAYRTVFGLQGCKDAETATRDALIEFAHSKGLGVSTKK